MPYTNEHSLFQVLYNARPNTVYCFHRLLLNILLPVFGLACGVLHDSCNFSIIYCVAVKQEVVMV